MTSLLKVWGGEHISRGTRFGLLLRGFAPEECASAADEFVLHCIENTVGDEEHFYGVKFEPLLGEITDRVRGLDRD